MARAEGKCDATRTAPVAAERRALTPEEQALWQTVMGATERLVPTPPRPAPAPAAKPARCAAKQPPLAAEEPAAAKQGATFVVERRPRAAVSDPSAMPSPGTRRGHLPGLDKRRALRLMRGQLPLEGRLDLHGMTQAEARRVLDAYLARAAQSGKRCVLVITGKGAPRERDDDVMPNRSAGVLRRSVPRWLEQEPNRAHVVAFCAAQAKDGGDGALYVLLRRQR